MRIGRAIFPKGIKCSKVGFGTAVTHSLYSMLADDSVTAEHLASPTGFEPVLSPGKSPVENRMGRLMLVCRGQCATSRIRHSGFILRAAGLPGRPTVRVVQEST
jgi:hypothetical protein